MKPVKIFCRPKTSKQKVLIRLIISFLLGVSTGLIAALTIKGQGSALAGGIGVTVGLAIMLGFWDDMDFELAKSSGGLAGLIVLAMLTWSAGAAASFFLVR